MSYCWNLLPCFRINIYKICVLSVRLDVFSLQADDYELMTIFTVIRDDSRKVLGTSNCYEINVAILPSPFCLPSSRQLFLLTKLKSVSQNNQLTVHILIIDTLIWGKWEGGEKWWRRRVRVNTKGREFTDVRARLYWVFSQ